MFKRFFLVPAIVVFLSGCAIGQSKSFGGSPEVRLLSDTTLPIPSGSDVARVTSGYAIGAFDKLSISVFGLPELSQNNIQVDAGGAISVPLAGSLDVAGKTTAQVIAEIESRLRAAHVRNPKVAVNIMEATSQNFTVEGEVRRPGVFSMAGPTTLLGALARAEGTAEFASLDDVLVFRTVDGQRYAAIYNLGAIRRGAYVDPPVFARDVIVVGDSPQRRLFKDFLQVVPLLTTPLIVAMQN